MSPYGTPSGHAMHLPSRHNKPPVRHLIQLSLSMATKETPQASTPSPQLPNLPTITLPVMACDRLVSNRSVFCNVGSTSTYHQSSHHAVIQRVPKMNSLAVTRSSVSQAELSSVCLCFHDDHHSMICWPTFTSQQHTLFV